MGKKFEIRNESVDMPEWLFPSGIESCKHNVFDPERLRQRFLKHDRTPPNEFVTDRSPQYYIELNASADRPRPINFYIIDVDFPAITLFGCLNDYHNYGFPRKIKQTKYSYKIIELQEILEDSLDTTGKKLRERELIRWLATLSPLEYDRARIESSKELEVRPCVLDAVVSKQRKLRPSANFKGSDGYLTAHQETLDFVDYILW